ncbi:MAG: large-conductance mechanosensitive channel protein MscL [Anaerotignum sp.]
MALKDTIQEFKEFAVKGNVVDMAVGVIIGGAFGKIVTSFVNDLIMPVIGKITGGTDFTQLFLPLDGNTYATLEEAQAATATIAYGSFITQVLDFLIVAIVIFAALKVLVKLKRPAAPEPEAEPTTKVCPFCKSEIAIEATRCPHCTSQLAE